VQVGHPSPAAAAAQAIAKFDGREVLSMPGNEIDGVEETPVLAAAANGDEGHLGGDQLPEGPANTSSRA